MFQIKWLRHNFDIIAALVDHEKVNFLTFCGSEKLQTSFILSLRPTEFPDADSLRGTRQESKQRLDSGSELSTAPLITKINQCCQSEADEIKDDAVGALQNKQPRVHAKTYTQVLIELVNSTLQLAF